MILSVVQAEAWGSKGHRIIGYVADELLSPKARTTIRELMGTDDLARIGNYMDQQKNQLEQRIPGSRRWHYDNIPLCARQSSPAEYCIAGACASAQLSRHRRLLMDPQESKASQQFALLVLTHLLGDIHQPLHAANNNDRGGNDVKVILPDGRRRNLHEFWDTALVEQRFAGQNEVDVAKRLVHDYAMRAVEWQAGTVEEWIADSHRIAKEVAYGALPGFGCGQSFGRERIRVSEAYLKQSGAVVEEQLGRAGYRLAHTLNLVFGQ